MYKKNHSSKDFPFQNQHFWYPYLQFPMVIQVMQSLAQVQTVACSVACSVSSPEDNHIEGDQTWCKCLIQFVQWFAVYKNCVWVGCYLMTVGMMPIFPQGHSLLVSKMVSAAFQVYHRWNLSYVSFIFLPFCSVESDSLLLFIKNQTRWFKTHFHPFSTEASLQKSIYLHIP